ncbi:MAG: hypothetical protein IPK44_02565 [Candidatus Accumulibacter sp.]|uniref:hypothetical protein n=1 Tax=Accumulibacter sp. TaxID=2053492 RepID=UPI00258B1C4F|nr:hypothetical protein [Accumulibacter sp.]MBK8113485.1 hypothetical protein [Accumulibacter sp.]
MARRESGSDRWSHPAIYWAAVKIGSYDLSRKSPKELDKEWRKAYSDQLAIGQWGDIPERLRRFLRQDRRTLEKLGKKRYRPCWRGSRAPQTLIARRQTMALNPISEDLDPLLWAKRPRSQCALSLLRTGAAEGGGELATILSSHVRDGVCDESGKLLMRWDGLRYVSLAADRERYAA